MMINCAIYPRKSKQVDNSDSMAAQIDMCVRYLDEKYGKKKYRYTIYDGDYGITGHSTKKRKDFLRMMDDVKAKKIQLVVIQRFDRIARNTRDFCNLYHDMEQAGCDLVSVSQQIDTTTPYGKNFMYMQASMAELEWALCSERRKDANKYAISVGKWTRPNHCTPFGYVPSVVDGIRKLIIDNEKKDIVKELFQDFNLYHNYCRTAKLINDKYGLNLTNNIVKKIIHNPIYKGKYHDNDNFCPAYLTSDEWDALQIEKPLVRQDKRKHTEILFSGLIRCPVCNKRMRAQMKKSRNGTPYRYYHCEYHSSGVCSFKKVKSELIIESQMLENMSEYLQDAAVSIQEQNKNRFTRDVSAEKKELERLNTMFLKGRISEEMYDTEYLRLNEIISLYEANTQPQRDINAMQMTFSGNWKEMYLKLNKLHRKIFWQETISQIIVDENMDVIGILFL